MGNQPSTDRLHVVSNGIHAPSSFTRSSSRDANPITEDIRSGWDCERANQENRRTVLRMGEMVRDRSIKVPETSERSPFFRDEHAFVQQVLPSVQPHSYLRFFKTRTRADARRYGRDTTLAKRRSNGKQGWRLMLQVLIFIMFAIALSIFMTALVLNYINVEIPVQ